MVMNLAKSTESALVDNQPNINMSLGMGSRNVYLRFS